MDIKNNYLKQNIALCIIIISLPQKYFLRSVLADSVNKC